MIRGVTAGQDKVRGGGDCGASGNAHRGEWGFWETSLEISAGEQVGKAAFDEA